MIRTALFTLASALTLAGCMGSNVDGPATASGPDGASATLANASGEAKGMATVRPMRDGVHVDANVMGMAPGTYGIHLHQTGTCTAPDFTSAGPHWNPTSKQHGRDNPAGAHHGDLPNIVVGADGTGRISAHTAGTLEELLDADGASLVVHAGPDDYKTDPSGNSGARVACGVLTKG